MRPRALFKQSPEDFVVEEIDAYPACGEGPHVYVRIRKRALTTDAAVARLAEALGVDRRACGAAGMKDRQAIAIQRISVPDVAPERVLSLAGRWSDLEILEAVRHRNKLKPGHLHGNRFTITLREIEPAAIDAIATGLETLAHAGFPNAFGPQRFGRDGDNAERALAFVRGEGRPPRDPRERRLLFSALQSRWFNRVLAARVEDGSFRQARAGDLLKKHDTGGLFLCEDESVDAARAQAFEVSPTGPIFGAEMRRPAGAIDALEQKALADDRVTVEDLARHRDLGEGTRRVLRVPLESLRTAPVGEDALEVAFTLGKGVYATTALSEVVTLVEGEPRGLTGARP
jgi:tRNA pseudouridine13 synthase